MFVAFVLIILSNLIHVNNAYTPPSTNNTDLYPCDQNAWNKLVENAGVLQDCLDNTCRSDVGCICLNCHLPFMNALKQYSNVVENDTCAVERFENGVSEIVFRIISTYPCLVEKQFASVEAQCPDASKFMCGKKLPYFETSTIAVSQCRHAIRNYCSPLSLASSDSPYGITEGGTAVCACDQHSGVCETTSNNTNWPSPMNVSLYSLLCKF